MIFTPHPLENEPVRKTSDGFSGKKHKRPTVPVTRDPFFELNTTPMVELYRTLKWRSQERTSYASHQMDSRE
jgi:hypothetical protein